MKILKIPSLFVFAVLMSCNMSTREATFNKTETFPIADVEVLRDSITLNGNEGVWYYKNKPYSGYALRYHFNDSLKEKIGFYNGKKEGVAKTWSKNGVLRVESHYMQNRLVGSYKSWWENGMLGSEVNYINGKKNGIEKKWYPTGQLAKERHLVDGKEDGLQKAWLENGKLYVNYEAKNGRVFGLRRANTCYKLENEVVIKKEVTTSK